MEIFWRIPNAGKSLYIILLKLLVPIPLLNEDGLLVLIQIV